MERIRNKLRYTDNLIPGTYWDVTKSGKVIELRVKPCMDTDPHCYRLGIIQIGRIISRIRSMNSKEGTRPRINLFPNLSETQLAATIFWPEFLKALPKKIDPSNTNTPPVVSDERLLDIANQYGLSFIPALNLDYIEPVDTHRTFTIVSHSNQPFAWIKVGQFIQELSDLYAQSGADSDLTFEILPAVRPEGASTERKSSYQQIKMSINTRRKNLD